MNVGFLGPGLLLVRILPRLSIFLLPSDDSWSPELLTVPLFKGPKRLTGVYKICSVRFSEDGSW